MEENLTISCAYLLPPHCLSQEHQHERFTGLQIRESSAQSGQTLLLDCRNSTLNIECPPKAGHKEDDAIQNHSIKDCDIEQG
jgi:hypothetical protein